MRIVRRSAVAVAAVLLVVASATTASAGFSGASGATGCSGGVNMANGNPHKVYFSSLSSITSTAVTDAITNVINVPTDVNAQSVSAGTDPDVIVSDSDWTGLCGETWWSAATGTGTVGKYTCDVLESNSACHKASVYLHEPWINVNTAQNRRDLAAHELGHSLGLTHVASGSVMMQTYPKSIHTYSSTEISTLNVQY